MIELRFSGWFQCRLATDPDPYDETRGVTGYVHAYVGEPDLDRIVCFQPPAFARPLGPRLGVAVDRVHRDGLPVSDHPLLGARVDLLGSPKFEGRNGVVADDGLEPVYPFELEIARDDFRLVRSIAPTDPDYPYPEYFAGGVEGAPDEIREATGIPSLMPVWRATPGVAAGECRQLAGTAADRDAGAPGVSLMLSSAPREAVPPASSWPGCATTTRWLRR